MANMSYCRFHNTLKDLEDCRDALDSGEISSQEEKKKAKALVELCKEIADNYDEDYVDSIKTEDDDCEE